MSDRRKALALLSLLAFAGCGGAEPEPRSLLLATTTSVNDSGLLEALLPGFTAETGVQVKVVAVGTGAALRMGAEGNADALLTHAPAAERELVQAAAVVSRHEFMENHFVIAGPANDPAGVARAEDAPGAIRRIHQTRAPFVSRGDDSGTHKKEVALLKAAGVDPAGGWSGYHSTGAGMGLTLQVAGEREAYVLSDIGTFLAFRERTGLVALSKTEPALRNVYSFMRVNPERFPGVHAAEAKLLEDWLLREDVATQIDAFGRRRFGQPLFRPLEVAR